MNHFALRAFALAAVLLAAPVAARADATPTATVERLNTALLEVMKSAEELGYRGRFERLAPVLTEVFDFPAMAQATLGTHWSSIGTADQQAFTEAFADYSIGVFANRFDGYGGERFEVLGEEPARRRTVLVLNQIVKSDGEAIAINYLTREQGNGEGWRIVDTILGGSYSELATRRSEFTGIVERLGTYALIQTLKDKISGFAGE
ncbi:MAG: ABC transporter substrate-binding protein [Kiloniellaceae bacterium]